MRTSEQLRVVSWNVAGFRTINSLKRFDYGEENTSYFAEQIRPFDPHIVFLQETHTTKDGKKVLAEELAEQLDMPHVFNTVASPSHIDEDYNLGQAIISTRPIENQVVDVYPYPTFPLYWSNGTEAAKHGKILQHGEVDGITIANTQMLPINLWNDGKDEAYTYAEGRAGELAKEIEEILLELSLPLMLAGDFNYNKPHEIYPRLIEEKRLTDALPNVVNRPHESKRLTPNHIYYSEELFPVRSEVIETRTDHYLNNAEFEKSR